MKKTLKSIPIIILMGLIKYSPLVTTISGKLSGGKLYKGRSGNIISCKVKPINRRTPAQLLARADFREASGLWKTIFAINGQAWKAYASNISKKNRVGDTHIMSAFNAWILEATRFLYIQPGVAIPVQPPTAVTPILNGNLAHGVAVGGVTQTFVVDIPLVSTGDILVISATPPMSIGKTFVKGKFRPIIFQAAHAAQPAFTISSLYTAEFGEIQTGKQIQLSAEYVSIAGSKMAKYLAGSPIEVIAS